MKALKTLALPALAACALAQGPITDKVTVNFANPVTVAGTTLAPGEYTIRQMPSNSNPRVLEFSSDDGKKIEVTATAFATLSNMTRHPTSVILKQRGGNYQIHQVWIGGKNYGYEFVPDDTGAAGDTLTGLQMRASYQANPPVVAQATPPPETQTTTQTETQTQTQTEQQTQSQAQTTPAPEQPTQAAPEPQQATQAPAPEAQTQAPEPAPAPSAPAETPTSTPAMPATAAHWPAMILSGLLMAGAGTLLSRKR